jgi:hypothetical protein
MTDNTTDKIAKLEAEVAALKAKVEPPKSNFVPMSDEEHRDWLHQMRERQANSWMPPNAIRDLVNGEPIGFMQGVLRDNRAPTGRPGMIPQEQVSGARAPVPSPTPGWVDPTPLGPPPGIELIDRAVNAALPHGPEWGKEKK